MSLQGSYDADEYQPEYEVLSLRDAASDGNAGWHHKCVLTEHATEAEPGGTICRAGYGWLHATAGNAPVAVRLELHDCPPGNDVEVWDDVVETPYNSSTGAVGLTAVTGARMDIHLMLSGSGFYRVRAARNHGAKDTWRLQFWPAEVEAPRWLRRRSPAVSGVDTRRYLAADLVSTAAWTGPRADVTMAWLAEHLLAPEEMVRAALDYAAEMELLEVTGDLRLTVLPRLYPPRPNPFPHPAIPPLDPATAEPRFPTCGMATFIPPAESGPRQP